MANPFLFMEDESSAAGAVNDAFSNPFLVEDDDEEAGDFSAENPFSASNPFAFGEADDGTNVVATTAADLFPSDTVTQTGANLFLVEDEDDEQQVDATMSFFGTTINEHDGLEPYQKPVDLNVNQHEHAYESEDELRSKKPPRPNPPPSQITQQLITNLTDHLDQTSTNLLGKLPVTRTPSPVSMRDIHSPSPTPDFGDLLDVSEAFAVAQQVEDESFTAQPIQSQPEAEHKPSRPPPPRPVPPRPTPPKGSLKSSPVTAPTPVHPVHTATVTQAQSQPPEDDLFNFFGTGPQKKPPPKPPAPKSKEDILSLFTAPTQPVQPTQKPDLLSEDIDFSVQAQNQTQTPVAVVNPYEPQQEIINETPASIPQAIVEPMVHQPVENHVAKSQSIPTIAMDLTPDQPVDIDEHPLEHPTIIEDAPRSELSSDPSPESGITSGGIPASASGSILNMQMQEPETIQETPTIQEPYQEAVQEEANPFQVLTPPEQLQQLQFLQQKSSEYQYQRPTTPDPIVAQPELAPIFGGPMPTSPAKQAPPPPPARGGSVLTSAQPQHAAVPDIFQSDEFDDFSAKFESKSQPKSTGNAFLDSLAQDAPVVAADAWGDSDAFGGPTVTVAAAVDDGFGNDEDGFDTWDVPVVPESTPYMNRRSSGGSDEGRDFSVVIKPKGADIDYGNVAPILGPPQQQKSPYSGSVYSEGEFECCYIESAKTFCIYSILDSSPRVNPFDSSYTEPQVESSKKITLQITPTIFYFRSETPERRDSQDSGPGTPLFDEDVSQPLEDFPRIFYEGPGWEMQLRQPNKKKITGQRFWKKVFVRVVFQGDNPVVQLLNKDTDKEPFQELPLQGCYSISDIAAQQFDNFGKIFTIKLQYVFYKERPGVRPGQVTKAERITTKLSMFAKYAIEGDYQGVKEFGSDLKKLGLPVEHAPQMSQLFKLGSMNFEDLKQFSMCIEEALFKLNVHRDRALTYKMEEVQVTAVDEIYVEQNAEGHIEKQIARVRLFFLGFLSGMPDIELGLNDLWRQGKEVVGRHDIIPVATEEWIRLEGVEFHSCVQQDQYERTRTIKFKPPDACYIELMRFRVRPPKNRELPLQLKATWVVTGNKVQLRADVLVPGFTSRKLGQIPCEDVAIRFPIPECWIYLFRVEKHFRYGSVKSTHRRTGKIKGIERFLGTVETLQESLIEVTSGQAKYEHHHRAIVWRCPRLPKEGQGKLQLKLYCAIYLTICFIDFDLQVLTHLINLFVDWL